METKNGLVLAALRHAVTTIRMLLDDGSVGAGARTIAEGTINALETVVSILED